MDEFIYIYWDLKSPHLTTDNIAIIDKFIIEHFDKGYYANEKSIEQIQAYGKRVEKREAPAANYYCFGYINTDGAYCDEVDIPESWKKLGKLIKKMGLTRKMQSKRVSDPGEYGYMEGGVSGTWGDYDGYDRNMIIL